jgi:hypothetical protein
MKTNDETMKTNDETVFRLILLICRVYNLKSNCHKMNNSWGEVQHWIGVHSILPCLLLIIIDYY